MASVFCIAANADRLNRDTLPGEVNQLLDELIKPDCIVVSRPCPTNTKAADDYLGRHTYRIAISNQ